MTLIATIAAIALVAVGIGYAYTAMTSNTGNTASPEYITLYQQETGAYQFANGSQHIYWNTVDGWDGESSYTTTYKLSDNLFDLDSEANDDALDDYTLVQVGSVFKIVPDLQIDAGTPVGDIPATLTGVIDATKFVGPLKPTASSSEAAVFILIQSDDSTQDPEIYKVVYKNGDANILQKYNSTSDKFSDANTFTIYQKSGQRAYHPSSVTVLYGYLGTDGVIANHAKGSAPAAADQPSSNPLTAAGLSFTLFKSGVNGGATDVSGVALGDATKTVVIGTPGSTTVTVSPDGASNKAVVVSSADPTKVVGAITAEGTLTIYGISATAALTPVSITVTTIDGSQTDSIDVTVNAS